MGASASASAPAAALRAMVWEPGYHLSDRKEPVEEAADAAAVVVVVSDDAPFLAVVAAAAEVAATVVLPCGEAVVGGVDCDVGEADLRHCYSSSSVFASYQVRHIRHRRTVPAAAAAAVDDALAVAAGHFDHIVGPDHTAVVAAHHQDHPRGSWSCCPPATSSAAAVDTVAAAAPPWRA